MKRQFAFGTLLLAVGVVCWALALSAWALCSAQWDHDRVSARMSEGVSFSVMDALRRQLAFDVGDQGLVSGWGQSSGSISCDATNASATVDVVWVDGDAEGIWKPTRLRGNLPTPMDTHVCALDEATALKLFGSLNVLGQAVRMGDDLLTVCGVYGFPAGLGTALSSPGRGLMFCPAARALTSVKLTALEFKIWPKSGASAKEQAQTTMTGAGLSGDSELTDHADVRAGLPWLVALPGVLLLALALLELFAGLRLLTRTSLARWAAAQEDYQGGVRRRWVAVCAWAMGACAMVGMGTFLLTQATFAGSIPPSYLPTRWADGAFWPKLVDTLLMRWAEAQLAGLTRLDLLAESWLWQCGALSVVASWLTVWALRALRRGADEARPAHIALGALAVALAAPAGLWLATTLNWPPVWAQGLCVLPAALYGVMVLFRNLGLPTVWPHPIPFNVRAKPRVHIPRTNKHLEKEG